MPMTTAQRATVRRRTSAAVAELSDAELDAIYDDATLGSSRLDYTTYYVLLEMVGVTASAIDVSNQVDELSIKASQRFNHLRKLLDFWSGITGLGALVDAGLVEGGIAAPCGVIIDCAPVPCLSGDCA